MMNTILAVSGVHTLGLVVLGVVVGAVGALLFLRDNPNKAAEANKVVGEIGKSVSDTAKKL